MKKLISILTILLIITVSVSALAERNTIIIRKAQDAVTLTASATHESQAIDLYGYRPTGFFSLQYAISVSAGTVTFEYYISNDGVNFVNTGADIGTSLSKTSGPGSDGNDLLSFSPEPARFMKIRATETSGTTAATVTTWLFVQ